MDLNRIEQIRQRVRNSRFSNPIAISSVYYSEDVTFLLATIDELTEDSAPTDKKQDDWLQRFSDIVERFEQAVAHMT